MPHVAIYAVISCLQAHTGFHIDNSARLIAWPQPEAKFVLVMELALVLFLKEVKCFNG